MKRKALESAVASPAALVLPSQLTADAAEAVREMLAEAAAANTTRSYATALRYWAGWYRVRFGEEFALPLSEAVVMQFVVDHVARKHKDGGLTWELPPEQDKALVAAGLKAKLGPWKLASVVHRVAVLSTAHKLKRLTNPCEVPAVRTVLSRARRASVKRGERPAKRRRSPRPSWRPCWPPATTRWKVSAIAPCSALASPVADGGEAKSRLRIFAI